MRSLLALIALGSLTTACSRAPILVWEADGGARGARSAAATSTLPPVAPGIRRGPWGEPADATLQLVDSDRAEEPHVHARHDLTVMLLRGGGTLMVEGRRYDLRAGDVVEVGRGAVHAFAPIGRAVALAIFTPRLDGPDYVPIPATANTALDTR